ncbi:MAG: hypothetical protein ACKO11_11795, partial [Cuspidothrix sp.]
SKVKSQKNKEFESQKKEKSVRKRGKVSKNPCIKMYRKQKQQDTQPELLTSSLRCYIVILWLCLGFNSCAINFTITKLLLMTVINDVNSQFSKTSTIHCPSNEVC